MSKICICFLSRRSASCCGSLLPPWWPGLTTLHRCCLAWAPAGKGKQDQRCLQIIWASAREIIWLRGRPSLFSQAACRVCWLKSLGRNKHKRYVAGVLVRGISIISGLVLRLTYFLLIGLVQMLLRVLCRQNIGHVHVSILLLGLFVHRCFGNL